MKRILLVATVQSHIAQFHKPLIQWLTDSGFQVDIAARNNLETKPNLYLETKGEIYDVPFARSPFSPQNIKAYIRLRQIINGNKYEIVHCNTPVGGILARMAANSKRKRNEINVIYEAHGFHFFKGGSKKNWIIWYPIEKWFSRYTDVLITINKMDYDLANTKFWAKKTKYIPGVGLDLRQFECVDKDFDLREEFKLPSNAKIVISVGELNKNKNQQVIIRALSWLNDSRIHYFLVGNGPLKEELEELARKLKLEHNVHFLGYRRDVPVLYKSADVFVLPSLREGLGMASLEAMASGLPIVTSDRHGINDYSENGKTGFKCAPNDYKEFARGIRKIVYDESLQQEMGENNRIASRQFSTKSSMDYLMGIYREILNDE